MQLIQDLQQQHEQEVAALLKEKDQQLQKETAATLAGKEHSHTHTVFLTSACPEAWTSRPEDTPDMFPQPSLP